jgi:uncharacterized protein
VNSPTAAAADSVASPCTSVCTMDAAGVFCTGCFRTLDEIASWSLFDADTKRAVLAALSERHARLGQSRTRP